VNRINYGPGAAFDQTVLELLDAAEKNLLALFGPEKNKKAPQHAL
jgi:hypothetical protein